MAEPVPQASDSHSHSLKPGAPKDKCCKYCHQAFTSSSLGRHLDLFIKDKNPKPPDGVHDVDEIRKLRGSITRRHPRGSAASRKASASAAATPRLPPKRESSVAESDSHKPSAIPQDGHYAVDSTLSKFPLVPRWTAVGAVNEVSASAKAPWDPELPREPSRRASALPRSVSKQAAQKAQFDVKQKLTDAMDTARAAELALRELLSSYRAAKRHKDNKSMPFDFDPLSLDFPALTLRCLCPPPTLFSSTQHPTSTSWSVQSPTQREFGALKAYFQQEFRAWKLTCASATSASLEELTCPPAAHHHHHRDAQETIKSAELAAENLERQVEEHLQSAYMAWQSLPAQRQQELWILELARGVGRKNKDIESLKAQRLELEQENANLRSQIDQLNRQQQPREFQLLPPTTIPLDRDAIAHAYEQGVRGGRTIGFDLDDGRTDLSTIVTKSIEKWKNVIASTRPTTGGLGAQKALDHAALSPAQPVSQTAQPAPQPQLTPAPKRLSTASTRDQTASSVSNTGPPSIEETSDQDADAEMEDDDSFAIMNASPVKPAHTSMPQPMLDVPRTRGLVQPQQNAAHDLRYMMHNGAAGSVGRSAMSMNRSMANMNMTMQGNPIAGAELGLLQPVRSDAMYME
ncbi:hypothetical protein XA68_16951 [Ophiocordyceps unilateralis]|uniref:Uncharacterized protein n=1 Tax=Ophiocordyceps unilateralis TaxID=268505 RepID=A0A2A9P5M2_OPHUN|nr:hypothetical protein XA68_16951 [Ophiocordyceps unilateralis]